MNRPGYLFVSHFSIAVAAITAIHTRNFIHLLKRKHNYALTRGQSNLTKSASRGAHSPVKGHPRGSKVVPLNSWVRVSY